MDELISGGISGAITDPYCDEAEEHAERYYNWIRKRKSHSDVRKIAKNTGYSYEQILQIKNYLFIDEHLLDGGFKRFTPSFEIAQSWQRLENNSFVKHDLTLLKHELMEMELIGKGYSQSDAHKTTSQTYDYPEESTAYYKELGCVSDPKHSKNSGGIKRDKRQKTNWEERY